MGKDYYKILGISRDADEKAIKKGYRTQAMKWHPDRNGDNVDEATEKFKDINEAFEVLSDKNKKAIYDQFGEEGLKQGAGGMGTGMGGNPGGGYSNFRFTSSDPFDIFNQFFGGRESFGGFGGMGGMGGRGRRGGGGSFFGGGGTGRGNFDDNGGSFSRRRQPMRKGKDVVHDMYLDLKDYYYGIKKRLRVHRLEKQPDGRYVNKPKILEFEIPPGMKEGVGVRFAKEGDQGDNIIPADVVFKLRTNKHPQFERDGNNNLIYNAKISLFDALTGTTLIIPTFDGRRIRAPIGKISNAKYEHTIWGEGMPIYKSRNGEKGNLIIRFDVQFPSNVNDFRRKLNEKCGNFRSN